MTDEEIKERAEVLLAYANAPVGQKPTLEWQNSISGEWHIQTAPTTALFGCSGAIRIVKPKKLVRKPCGPEHFPPGTVVRSKGQNHWQLVVWCRETGICGISRDGHAVVEGFDHFIHTTERSIDNGKTWLPCYVEVEE